MPWWSHPGERHLGGPGLLQGIPMVESLHELFQCHGCLMLSCPTAPAQISALVASGPSFSAWEGPTPSTLGSTLCIFVYIKPPSPLQQLTPGLRLVRRAHWARGLLPLSPASLQALIYHQVRGTCFLGHSGSCHPSVCISPPFPLPAWGMRAACQQSPRPWEPTASHVTLMLTARLRGICIASAGSGMVRLG